MSDTERVEDVLAEMRGMKSSHPIAAIDVEAVLLVAVEWEAIAHALETLGYDTDHAHSMKEYAAALRKAIGQG